MKNKLVKLLSSMALGLAMSSGVGAALIDRGSGLIYDAEQDITWLADANFAQTSGYDSDGYMLWGSAMSWASNLTYGGFDDWRLPEVSLNCAANNCSSELRHLVNIDLSLGGLWALSGASATDPDIDLFSNLENVPIWSGTEVGQSSAYRMIGGVLNIASGKSQNYGRAWAVRDGDVGATVSVAEPSLTILIAGGLLGLITVRRFSNS